MEYLSKIGELIENCGQISKLLISSEIAINDGDLALSQKSMVEAQALIKVMLEDVFLEVKEEFNIDNKDVFDYDIPTTLELVKFFNDAVYNAGVLINLLIDKGGEEIIKSIQTKIVKDLNTIEEIATAIFFN